MVLSVASLLVWPATKVAGAHVAATAEPASATPPIPPPTAGDTFAPDLGVPATDVVAFGVSPGESPNAAWAYGKLDGSNAYTLFEHLPSGAWRTVSLTPEGASLGEVELGALGAQATFAGGVVVVAETGIAVRNPGSSLQLAPAPEAMQSEAGEAEKHSGQAKTKTGMGTSATATTTSATATAATTTSTTTIGTTTTSTTTTVTTTNTGNAQGVLGSGESVPPSGAPTGASTPYAAVEEGGGTTGVLIAPYHDGLGAPGPGILHYDGSRWTREPIVIPAASGPPSSTSPSPEAGLTPAALACGGTAASPGASSPTNCWLLAAYEAEANTGALNRLALFQRVPSSDPSGYSWRQAQLSDPSSLLATAAGEPGQSTVIALGAEAQMLTVTATGLWVDFQAKVGSSEAPVSEFLTPQASAPGSAPTAHALESWCFHPGSGAALPESSCTHELEQSLPGGYRSFAWPGAQPGASGTRIITGFPERALLELQNGHPSYITGTPTGSDASSAPGGGAFISPHQGWIADGAGSLEGADGDGQSEVIEVSSSPAGSALQEESVPFRHPLLAVAQAPGTTPGDPGAEAVAVGADGQITRYQPGAGWRPEELYNAAGEAQTTKTLRGVAWPESGRIYAVGDNGTMWLWRAETGLWEPDPAKPFNFIGNLTAIAFAPSNPALGYAVGKQGALLKYGKSWEAISPLESGHLEEELHVEEQDLDFTSIAFAGDEALATYRLVGGKGEIGGIIVDEGGSIEEGGSGWHAEPNIPQVGPGVLSKVAGLPDGGVVAAGPGEVIERDGPGDPWRFSSEPPPETQNISALAAYREPSGSVRAIVSVDLNSDLNPNPTTTVPFQFTPWGELDAPPPTGSGQPPFFVEADPLPASGYVLKETAEGWIDMEHAALPAIEGQFVNQPRRPDPVLALLVDPTGTSGLAVGGQTGDFTATPHVAGTNLYAQTGAAMRFPTAAASANGASPSPVAVPAGQVSFVVAGQAACIQTCQAGEEVGPEVWLTHALALANRVSHESQGALSAFLYTGSSGGVDDLASKLGEYGEPLPIYAAGFPSTCSEAGHLYCHEIVHNVRVLMLTYAGGALEAGEEAWLRQELAAAAGAQQRAIVVGNAALGFKLPEETSAAGQRVQEAGDAAAVSKVLVEGHAAAYFFDYPGGNVKTQVPGSPPGEEIPAYGSGTIGYVSPPFSSEAPEADLLGSSGFLLATVPPCTGRGVACRVSAQVIPNVSQLSMDGTEGVLLRRSHVALFEALARRPQGGSAAYSDSPQNRGLAAPNPYDQIPFDCQGSNCQYEVPTAYTFYSSEPDKGAFVAHELGSGNPDQVELGPNKLPVIDEPRNARGELNPDGRFSENSNREPINEKGETVPADQSGLFCAFNPTGNKPVIVSVTTGGLTYSEPVTIQAGSVEYPCGTVPLKNPPPAESTQLTGFPSVPLATSNPPQANPQVQTIVPPPPPVAAAATVPHPARPHPPTALPFLPLATPAVAALPAIVPPPGPPVPRPIPPSGTSPVYQSAVAPEDQREEETATSLVGLHEFSAYRADEHGGPGPWLPLLLILAAGAGTGIYRGTHSSSRRRLALARAGTRRSPPM
jgi:hypothetical protein